MADPLTTAISTLLQPGNFLLVVLGVLFGMFVGIIPGMGGVVALAVLTPLTFGMDPLVAFMFLIAVLGGTNYGGSVTAILLNTPGTSTNVATIFDGYPMARAGRAGEAIGASSAASAVGAIFGITVVVLLIPVMQQIVLAFGPPQVFWLAIWGLTIVATVVRGDVLPGLVSAGLGILFALHGFDPVTGTPRFTYDVPYLYDGIKLIPALVGLFAIGEMFNLLDAGTSVASDREEDVTVGSGRIRGALAVWEHKWVFLRASILGTIIGMIPGVGGTTANYLAYFQAKETSSDPESFGTGDVRGVVASEASNDAKDGGGLLPTLGLGIPGSAAMAVLLGAFLLHGIVPGPLMLTEHMDIFAVILLSLLVSNILTSAIGLTFAKQLSKVTTIPVGIIAPVVITLAFIGVFTVDNNVFDLFMALGFGVLALGMSHIGMSRVPMVLGIVLGPIAEDSFSRSLQISSGSYSILYEDPLSIILIVLVCISLLLPYLKPRIGAVIDGVRR